jgi:hypothetical protein
MVLILANWKDGAVLYAGRWHPVRRGELAHSLETIAEEAAVSAKVVRSAVKKFLIDDTQTGGNGPFISVRWTGTKEGTGLRILTVRNYERWQDPRTYEGTAQGTPEGEARARLGHGSGTAGAPREEGEEVEEGKKEAAAGPLPIGRLPSALPSPAEVDSARWPAIEQLAQHLANLRGLTACPLTWPKRDNRDRLETAIARATVARSAQCALAVWRDAAKNGKLVSSLGFFVGAIEALGQPGPQEQPLSTCAEWDAVLQQVRKYSADAGERLAKATPRIAGGALVLSADAPLADAIRELYWSRLEPLVQSIHGLRLEVEQEKPCPTSLHSV